MLYHPTQAGYEIYCYTIGIEYNEITLRNNALSITHWFSVVLEILLVYDK